MRKKHKTPLILDVIRWIFPKLEKSLPGLAHWLFIKLFFTPFRFTVPEKEKKAESYAEKFSVQVCGKKIQCYSWGNGSKTILLVHGWAGRVTQFRRFIKPLMAAGYRVVGFDGPAHGNSEGRQTNLFEFEEVIKKIYAKVGVPHAVIAHSFGGGVMLFAALNGLPVIKLINISSPTIGDEILKTYLKTVNASSQTADFFKSYMIRSFNKSFDEFTSLHFIKHIRDKIDLLMIHDEDDQEVSIEHSEELLKIYPEAKLYKTKELGHTRILKNDEVIKYCVTYITT